MDMLWYMKALLGGMVALLMAFVVFHIYTWWRVIEIIPASSSGPTTLVRIARETAMVRPFFLGTFVITLASFELFRRRLNTGWRIAYLITLGLSTALLVAPWLVDVVFP
jgi:hypothetical protein